MFGWTVPTVILGQGWCCTSISSITAVLIPRGMAASVYRPPSARLAGGARDVGEVTVLRDQHWFPATQEAAEDARSRAILEAHRSMKCRQARCANQPLM